MPLSEIMVHNAERSFLGHFFNSALCGVLSVQTYLYFVAFPNDSRSTKLIVVTLYILSAIQTCLIAVNEFVSNAAVYAGDPMALDKVGNTWYSVPIMSGIISGIVQGVYIHRIYILSNSKSIFIVVVILCALQTAGVSAAFILPVGVQIKRAKLLSSILSSTKPLITVGIREGCNALCDMIIALCMHYYLHTRKTGFQRTKDLVNRIIKLSFGTGSVTATFALATLITVYVPGQQQNWLTTSLILGKTYSISMMVIFNSRCRVVSSAPKPVWNERLADSPRRFTAEISTLRFATSGRGENRHGSGVECSITCEG